MREKAKTAALRTTLTRAGPATPRLDAYLHLVPMRATAFGRCAATRQETPLIDAARSAPMRPSTLLAPHAALTPNHSKSVPDADADADAPLEAQLCDSEASSPALFGVQVAKPAPAAAHAATNTGPTTKAENALPAKEISTSESTGWVDDSACAGGNGKGRQLSKLHPTSAKSSIASSTLQAPPKRVTILVFPVSVGTCLLHGFSTC